MARQASPQPGPNQIDKKSIEILAEIVRIIRSRGEGIDALSYRAQNSDDIVLLDRLERTGFLRKEADKYWVSLAGLSLLGDRESKALLKRCELLFSLLRDRYKANPRDAVKVKDLARLAGMSFKKAGECLGYMVQVHWSGSRSLEFNDPAKAFIEGSETILRYKSFKEVVAEAIRLQNEQVRGASFGFAGFSSPSGSPLDTSTSAILHRVDAEHVHGTWQKALERRFTDPDGAITAARTLLEEVCKFILDEENISYRDATDLPELHKLTVKQLTLAPSQHTEDAFKQILGGCQGIVLGLSTLRNRLSDSHGKGRTGMKPAPRHAELAVNLAGVMATFLIHTWEARKKL